jgi:hypothetical protein
LFKSSEFAKDFGRGEFALDGIPVGVGEEGDEAFVGVFEVEVFAFGVEFKVDGVNKFAIKGVVGEFFSGVGEELFLVWIIGFDDDEHIVEGTEFAKSFFEVSNDLGVSGEEVDDVRVDIKTKDTDDGDDT